MATGTVPGMLEWIPINSGGAFAPIVSVIWAPQSPPCATNRAYPPFHQREPGVRDVNGTPPRAGRLAGEPVAGHGRNHDIKRVARLAAVCGRVGKRADDVQHLDDRAGPAARDERQRVLVRRLDVDEVDVEAVDLGDELR